MSFVVDGNAAILYNYAVTGQAHDALHEDARCVLGKAKDDNLATGRYVFFVLAEHAFDEALSVTKFGYDQIIGVVQRGDHAGADYVIGLKYKIVQYQYDCNGKNNPRKYRPEDGGEAAGNRGYGGSCSAGLIIGGWVGVGGYRGLSLGG